MIKWVIVYLCSLWALLPLLAAAWIPLALIFGAPAGLGMTMIFHFFWCLLLDNEVD